MEFCVVVAAAGAGYVAQYLQSSSEEKDNLLPDEQSGGHGFKPWKQPLAEMKGKTDDNRPLLSSPSLDPTHSGRFNAPGRPSTHEQSDNKNLLHQLREKVCPFRILARRRAKKEVSDEGVFRFRQLNLDSSDCISDEKDSIFPSREASGTKIPVDHKSTRNKDSGGKFKSTGLENGMALLYMGIVSGMMSAVIANKREIEKVNDKLKWTKNLVQELEEELNVKEIEAAVDEPIRRTSESTNHDAAENHESMSEIEAELEAELERLEMSLKVSNLERIPDFVELDPEDEVDLAQGDLTLDCLNVQTSDSSESDSDTSGTWIVHSKPANYPVSPRELSSRLHEVIESRLEARIKELETALRSSQNRVCSLETQHHHLSEKNFASSEIESSVTLQSPYWYHESDEEIIRIMHGSENTFDFDTSIPPFDGELNDGTNEKMGSLVHKCQQPTLMQLLKTEFTAETRELKTTQKQHYHCS